MKQTNQLAMFENIPFAIRPQLAEIPIKRWPHETNASSEGREFLKLITEVDAAVIDNKYEPYAIEAWLEEMGYEWNGGSWVFNGSGEG